MRFSSVLRLFAAASFLAIISAVPITPARAEDAPKGDHCRTAADEQELKDLEKELDSLKAHKLRLQLMKQEAQSALDSAQSSLDNPTQSAYRATNERRIADAKAAIIELDEALQENATRTHDVETRIAALKALKACTPEPGTPPPPPPPSGPGGVAPGGQKVHLCRTPQDEARLKALQKKKAMDEKELAFLKRMIREVSRQYAFAEKAKSEKAMQELTAKLTAYETDRGVLEGEIAALNEEIKKLSALKPCVEEPTSKTEPPRAEPPKKHPKHGKKAVGEDDPSYMENYIPPAHTKTTRVKRHDDEGGPPGEEPGTQENDDRPPGDTEPDIPMPH